VGALHHGAVVCFVQFAGEVKDLPESKIEHCRSLNYRQKQELINLENVYFATRVQFISDSFSSLLPIRELEALRSPAIFIIRKYIASKLYGSFIKCKFSFQLWSQAWPAAQGGQAVAPPLPPSSATFDLVRKDCQVCVEKLTLNNWKYLIF